MEDGHHSKRLSQFSSDYQKYIADVLKPTRDELQHILSNWRQHEHWVDYTRTSRQPIPSPIQRAFTRIKRPESVVDKIYRKSSDFPAGLSSDSFQRMYDAVAGRIIVYFLGNLPLIDREIRQNQHFEMSSENPPIAYLSEDLTKRLGLSHLERRHKESGYVSIHYILRLRNSAVPENDRPWFELQVRTLTEDVWGEIEHVLGYKPQKRTSLAVTKQFQILSNLLGTVDETFNFLFDELSRFQEEVSFHDSDPLNAENLPPVLAEFGLSCAQSEIDGLLKLLASRGVDGVGVFRALATIEKLQMIRSTYIAETGRQPVDFEIIATLAAMQSVQSREDEVEAIKQQIEFQVAWDNLKNRS